MKAQTLFISPDARAQHFTWLLIEDGERQSPASGAEPELAEALAELASRQPQVVFVLPAEAALHTAVEVPKRQRRFLSRSLPFILEAQTAQDIEELHIVPGDALAGDLLGVYALPHRLVKTLLRLTESAGLSPRAMVLETQLLAARGRDRIHIAWQGERVLVSVPGRGMACTRQNLSAWLDRLVPEGQTDWPVALYVNSELTTEANTLVAELEQTWPTLEPVQTVAEGWLPMLADFWLENPRVRNLLTGPYEQVNALQRWKPAFVGVSAALGLLAVSGALYFAADLRQTEARAEATWTAAENLFAEAVDGSMSLQRQRVRQQLDDLISRADNTDSEGGTFLPLLVRVNSALNGDQIRLEELRFTADRSELQIQVRAQSTEDLEALRSELEAQDLGVTYSAGRTDDGFRGNFRIQGTSDGGAQ